jgi:hypothetical protein
MPLSDDEIRHVAGIVRAENGHHWTVDKTIMVGGVLFTCAVIVAGWLWIGGGLARQVADHTVAIENLFGVLRTVKDDTVKTASAVSAVSTAVDRVERALAEASRDRKSQDKDTSDKIDRIDERLSTDEGLLKRERRDAPSR